MAAPDISASVTYIINLDKLVHSQPILRFLENVMYQLGSSKSIYSI